MNEKRFGKLISDIEHYLIGDILEDKRLTIDDIIVKMNELHEENRDLKKIILLLKSRLFEM